MGGMREYNEKRMLKLAGLLREAAGDDLSPEPPMQMGPVPGGSGALPSGDPQGPEWEAFKAAVDDFNRRMTAELDLLRDIAIVPDPRAYWDSGVRTFDEFKEELASEAAHEAAKELIYNVADEPGSEEAVMASDIGPAPEDIYDTDPYGRGGNAPMWQRESRKARPTVKERVFTVDLAALLNEGPPPVPLKARLKSLKSIEQIKAIQDEGELKSLKAQYEKMAKETTSSITSEEAKVWTNVMAALEMQLEKVQNPDGTPF